MPTKDIAPGIGFEPGDTAPSVRTKLNANLVWAEAAVQGVEDRLETTLASVLGDGVVSGLAVSPSAGLTVAVAPGTALVGFAVSCAGGTLAAPASSVSAVRLTQSGSLDIRPSTDAPPSERSILLATVSAGSESVGSVDNAPVGRSSIRLLAAWDAPSGAPVDEALVGFDPEAGHRHDGLDARPLEGTPAESFSIGDGSDRTLALYAHNADAAKPGIRYSHADDRWEYSNDGAAWNSLGSGGGTGVPSDSVVPATSYGSASSAGIASSYARGDHSHGTPALGATTPMPLAAGAAGSAGAATLPARQDHAHAVATAAPEGAFGVTASEGASTSLARADHVHAAFDSAPPAHVAPVASAGVSDRAARRDHTHQGVHSLARSGDSQIAGDVVLAAGANVSLVQSGQTITISSAGGSGTLGDSVTAESSFGAAAEAGSSLSASRSDHTHGSPPAPVTSLATEGSAPLTGAVTLSAGANVTLTQTAGEIEIAAPTASPGGAEGQVQFHDGGALGGDAALTFDGASKSLTVGADGATQYAVTAVGRGILASRLATESGDAAAFVGLRRHASAIASGDSVAQLVGWGQIGAGAPDYGAFATIVASQDWAPGSACGSGWRFHTVGNGGTASALALEIAQDRSTVGYGEIVSRIASASGVIAASRSAASIATNDVLGQFVGRALLAGTSRAGALIEIGAGENWTGGSAHGSWIKLKTVANGSTAATTRIQVGPDGTTVVYGNCVFGLASTSTIDCTGRLRPRLLTADPLHASPASRPAGSVGEVARYGGDFYLCRSAATPEWARIGGTKSVSFAVVASDADVTTGDGKHAFCVPSDMAGMNLVGATARLYTAGSSGATEIQLRRSRDTAGTPRTSTDADMLSTKLTVDSGEVCSTTAATAAVVHSSYDDVQEGDLVLVDVDAVSATKPRGLSIALVFALPAPS